MYYKYEYSGNTSLPPQHPISPIISLLNNALLTVTMSIDRTTTTAGSLRSLEAAKADASEQLGRLSAELETEHRGITYVRYAEEHISPGDLHLDDR